MGRTPGIALYVLTMITIVVGIDVLFLRHIFAVRLIVNVGIVVLFGTFYLRFRKRA